VHARCYNPAAKIHFLALGIAPRQIMIAGIGKPND